MKLADISGKIKRNIKKLKFINMKLIVRSKISETCVTASIILSRVTSLELI